MSSPKLNGDIFLFTVPVFRAYSADYFSPRKYNTRASDFFYALVYVSDFTIKINALENIINKNQINLL